MKSSLNPQEATPLFEEARLLFDKGQHQKAIEILLNASDTFEKQQDWIGFLQAQVQLSDYYSNCKLYEKGIEAFEEKQKKIFPYLEENHVLVGKSHLEMGRNCKYVNQFEKGKQHLLTAIQIFQNQANPNQLDLTEAHEALAFCCGQLGDHKSQKQHYEKALDIKLAAKTNLKSISKTYESLAFAYQCLNSLDEMLECLNCSLTILQKEFGIDHPNTAETYFKIGFYYSMKGDTDQALAFTHKSLNLLPKDDDSYLGIISNCYNALGFLVGEKGDYEQQLAHFLEERVVIKKLYTNKELKKQLINNNSNIAYNYTQRGLYKEALTYLHETLSYCKEIYGEKHRQTIRIQDNIGVVLLKSGDLKKGYAHIQNALQTSLAFYGKKHYRVFHAYHHLGDYYLTINDTLQQIKAYQKAIIALIIDFNEEDYHQNPVLSLNQSDPIELSKVLSKKATALVIWYQSTQDPRDLRTAIATYKTSIDFTQRMRQNHQAEGSKLFLSKVIMRTFENAVHATYLLLEVTESVEEKRALRNTLFQFSEQSKAALLLSNVKESEAKINAAIPADLLEKEQGIKQELNQLQKKIAQHKAKGTSATDPDLLKLQGAYFDLQQSYQQVIKNFETNYPAYFQLKYNIEMVKSTEIKAHLQQENYQNLQYKTVVLSYFIGNKNIYILTFTDTSFEVKQIAKPKGFGELIQSLQESMQFIDLDDFIEAARALYRHLILPIEGLIKKVKKLVILRHDILEYLPFEVLLSKDISTTSKPIYADLPYLLQEFEICYHYSANLWLNGISKQDLTKHLPNTFLGLAPVSFNGEVPIELAMESKQGQNRVLRSNRAGKKALQQLPNTEAEVKDVYQFFQAKKLDAKAFLYGSASKENLMLEATKHKFILISTHGFVENEEAGLSGICLADVKQEPDFRKSEQDNTSKEKNTYRHSTKTSPQTSPNDYLFYTSDAYHLQLNADLVVLSSCSSGIGKLEKGEGMMAMNRGFLYAGASNIVFTQFDIPDQSSSLLVKTLFQYILEGKPYPTALQLAKREMIQRTGSSPQDWAGFVLIGC